MTHFFCVPEPTKQFIYAQKMGVLHALNAIEVWGFLFYVDAFGRAQVRTGSFHAFFVALYVPKTRSPVSGKYSIQSGSDWGCIVKSVFSILFVVVAVLPLYSQTGTWVVISGKVEIQGVSYDSYYDSSSVSRVSSGNIRFWLKAITEESLPANPDELVYAIYDEYMKNYRERQAYRDKENEYIRRMNERKSRQMTRNIDDMIDGVPDYAEKPPIEFVPPQLPYLPSGPRTNRIKAAYTLVLIEIDCAHSQFAVVQQKAYTAEGKEISNSTFSIPSWTPYSSYGQVEPTANLMRTICR